MKLINLVLIIASLFVGIQSTAQYLNCNFQVIGFTNSGSHYSCKVTRFINANNNVQIFGLSGTHMANRNDNSVLAIVIDDVNARFIPSNLGIFSNLIVFSFPRSQLTEISADSISGMRNLELINLRTNNLTSVPADLFSGLPNMKTIFLNMNQIAELPSGLLANNPRLEYFDISDNRIKHIAPGMFTRLPNLHSVFAINNDCLSQNFVGTVAIGQLRRDIQFMCLMPAPISPGTCEEDLLVLQTKYDKLYAFCM